MLGLFYCFKVNSERAVFAKKAENSAFVEIAQKSPASVSKQGSLLIFCIHIL